MGQPVSGSRRPWAILALVPVLLASSTASQAALAAATVPRAPGVRPETREARPYWRRNLFRRVLEDQPFLWREWWPTEARRPVFFGPLLGSVALATTAHSDDSPLDLSLVRGVDSHTRGRADALAATLTRVGDGASVMLLLGTSYWLARRTHRERLAEASSLAAEALLQAGIYSEALKRATRRTRPAYARAGEFFANAPPGQEAPNAFPSGHAMGAFAVAAVFQAIYRDRPWVGRTANGLAGLISLSRLALGRHFLSDVVAGAVIGRSLGRAAVARDRGEQVAAGAGGRWSASWDGEHGGVRIGYSRRW